MTQAENDFIEQFARVLLVEWCQATLVHGHIVTVRSAGTHHVDEKVASLCMDLALEKGWVGKSEPRKVLAKGFSTAAAFLKR